MSRGTAYYDLPNGERIELPTTMPDVEEVPGPLSPSSGYKTQVKASKVEKEDFA